MKKLLYTLFGLLFALTGCVEDNLLQPESAILDNGEVTIQFTASIPEFKTVQTRSNGGVTDMWVLVFDENDIFITRRQATLSNQTNTGGDFTVTLPYSTKKRIFHFVCNYDWSSFNDASAAGANEATVVGMMSTTDIGQPAFWSRREVTGGFDNSTFANPNQVVLLRNQAKISLINECTRFTLTGFTIHNRPSSGTVAPFNTGTAAFDLNAVTEPVGVTLIPAEETGIGTNERYLYERRNKNAAEITTIIVKGVYDDGTSSSTCYYKIDLIDAQKVRYDIKRNWHYVVTIKQITDFGHTTLANALAGASHNNTALDPIIEKFPMISDGEKKLEVEKTLVVLTEADKTFNVWYKFYPDVNDPTTVNNDGVSVTIVSNEGALSSNAADFSFDNNTGTITAKSAATLPTTPAEALIRVEKDGLLRTIRVVLRPAFSFTPVTINNLNPAVLPVSQNFSTTLRFFIPNDFPEELFPLPVNIYTQGLYAAATGLQIFAEGGIIRYVYKANTKGEQTVEFKTNQFFYEETVTLKADYFAQATVDYTRAFGNISYGSNTPIPNNSFVSASVGTLTIQGAGKYSYVPPIGADSETEVTLTYDKEINEGYTERYAITTTVGALQNNVALNLSFTFHLFDGILIYIYNNNPYNVPANSTVTRSPNIAGSIFANPTDGYYTYNVPAGTNMNTSVTFTYVRTGFWRPGTYSVTRTLEELKTAPTYNLMLERQ